MALVASWRSYCIQKMWKYLGKHRKVANPKKKEIHVGNLGKYKKLANPGGSKERGAEGGEDLVHPATGFEICPLPPYCHQHYQHFQHYQQSRNWLQTPDQFYIYIWLKVLPKRICSKLDQRRTSQVLFRAKFSSGYQVLKRTTKLWLTWCTLLQTRIVTRTQIKAMNFCD